MKKVLMNNLGLKITAVVLAIIAWFLVMNVSNPIRSQTYTNIPITVTNSSYIESMGLSCQLEQTSVSVSIRDNVSVVKSISASDIMVIADMTQIISMESDPVMVPLSVVCTKYPGLSADEMSVTPKNVAIKLEKLKSADFLVTPSAGDSKPDKDYEVGVMQVDPEKITISGPESIINIIDKVVVTVNVNGMDSDGTKKGEVVVIDKNQQQLDDYQMSYLTFQNMNEDGSVSVHINLWKVQKDVSITASASGTPKYGYQIGEVVTTPSKISLVGSPEALEQLALLGNVIEIPASAIDATDMDADFETKIDINEYLPENIRLATDVSSSVLVKTAILPYGSRDYEVPVSNITQNNLEEGLIAVFKENEITVRVKGSDAYLNSLKTENLTGAVDFAGLSPGTHTVPVEIILPSGMTLVNEVKTTVTISSTVQDVEEGNITVSKSN